MLFGLSSVFLRRSYCSWHFAADVKLSIVRLSLQSEGFVCCAALYMKFIQPPLSGGRSHIWCTEAVAEEGLQGPNVVFGDVVYMYNSQEIVHVDMNTKRFIHCFRKTQTQLPIFLLLNHNRFSILANPETHTQIHLNCDGDCSFSNTIAKWQTSFLPSVSWPC